jgi:hypothetical protein
MPDKYREGDASHARGSDPRDSFEFSGSRLGGRD